MAIDIDTFLDKFAAEKQENKHKVSLDFQKDVEDRLLDVQSRVKNSDVSILKKIYDEVKSFDEDLPSKFFGIEQRGGLVLNELGKTYSEEFLKKNRINADFLKKRIDENLLRVEELIGVGDFGNVLKIFKQVVLDFNSFPKVFLKERSIIASRLRADEVKIFSLFEKYRDSKVVEIKQGLRNKVLEAKKILGKSELSVVEEFVSNLQNFIFSMPDVLMSSLVKEKSLALRLLDKSELFLARRYEQDFKYKVNLIHTLFEKFHSSYVEKNLSEVLLVYNEILVLFKQLPDFFLEKKIELYNSINELFERVNRIVLSNNVLMFMGSYEYSRKIEAIREYLRSAKSSSVYSLDALSKLKSQILDLPDRFSFEREDFLEEIESLSLALGNRVLSGDVKLDLSVSTKSFSDESFDESMRSGLSLSNDAGGVSEVVSEISNSGDLKKGVVGENVVSIGSNKRVVSDINNVNNVCYNDNESKSDNGDVVSTQEVLKKRSGEDLLMSSLKGKEVVNKTTLQEINSLYERLKVCDDVYERVKIRDKIVFYLRILPVKREVKVSVLKKIKSLVESS